jgi:simple sugar transport system ATP-binding protein
LVGENGAGKTTLMRVAAGEIERDSGSVDARGLGLVHQHFALVPDFTIAENLALASHFRFRSRRAIEATAEAMIAASGITLAGVRRRVRDLSVGEKAKIELIKALAREPSVLVLDEPTAVLTPMETEELFAVLRSLAGRGTAVVFISHKLREVVAVARRVVVMRRGRIVMETREPDMNQIADAMVGPGSGPPSPSGRGWREAPGEGPRRIELRNLSAGILDRVSLDVHGHEIVAIVGVSGNGQGELARILRGLEEPADGVVEIRGSSAHIPEDRTGDGLVAEMSIAENISLGEKTWRRRESLRRAAELIERYSIRARSPLQRAGDLSGGNQQKVVLARALGRDPDVLVAAEPARGLDIEATAFVQEQLRAARARGAAILLITSDLDEAYALADAIYVIYRGRISERLRADEAPARVPRLMAGIA